MLSRKSRASLAQCLEIQAPALVRTLCIKHGIEYTAQRDLAGLVVLFEEAEETPLLAVLDEFVAARGDFRARVTPRYRFDQRYADLARSLAEDGWDAMGHTLRSVAPRSFPPGSGGLPLMLPVYDAEMPADPFELVTLGGARVVGELTVMDAAAALEERESGDAPATVGSLSGLSVYGADWVRWGLFITQETAQAALQASLRHRPTVFGGQIHYSHLVPNGTPVFQDVSEWEEVLPAASDQTAGGAENLLPAFDVIRTTVAAAHAVAQERGHNGPPELLDLPPVTVAEVERTIDAIHVYRTPVSGRAEREQAIGVLRNAPAWLQELRTWWDGQQAEIRKLIVDRAGSIMVEGALRAWGGDILHGTVDFAIRSLRQLLG